MDWCLCFWCLLLWTFWWLFLDWWFLFFDGLRGLEPIEVGVQIGEVVVNGLPLCEPFNTQASVVASKVLLDESRHLVLVGLVSL